MDVVFAMASGNVGGPDGLMVFVRKGTHWPASDPVVVGNPAMFSSDARWGLSTSVPYLEPEPAEPAPAGQRRKAAVPA